MTPAQIDLLLRGPTKASAVRCSRDRTVQQTARATRVRPYTVLRMLQRRAGRMRQLHKPWDAPE